MSWRMAVELISHPAAKDHASSILGLGFVLLVLIALFLSSLRLVPIAGMSGPLLGNCDQARRRRRNRRSVSASSPNNSRGSSAPPPLLLGVGG